MKLLRFLFFILFPLISSAAAGVDLAKGSFSMSAGAEFSTGKYGGTTPTDIFYLPVTARYATYRYSASLTVPYISVTSDGGVIPNSGGAVRGNRNMTTTSSAMRRSLVQSGWGDVIATAGYTLYDDDELMLSAVGQVKFGTANADKDLGTGENDYAAQIDSICTTDSVSIYASIGYKFVGVPAGYTLNNIGYGSVGVARAVGSASRVGLTLDVAQRTSAISEDRRSITAETRHGINESTAISVSLSRGFSASNADWLGGLYVANTF
jgi:hypothetical protein